MNKEMELPTLKYTLECDSIEEMEELKAKLNNKTEFNIKLSDNCPLIGKLIVEFKLKGESEMNNKELIEEVFVEGIRPRDIKVKFKINDIYDLEYHLSTLAKNLSKVGLTAELEIEIDEFKSNKSEAYVDEVSGAVFYK